MQQLLIDFGMALWHTLGMMAPYLLFGFLMAGLISVFISPTRVERHLGGDGLPAVIKASFLGVPLPLCSCSVIPVAASLRRHGAGRGPTMAFLLSTPQTGLDSIFVTYSLLGWVVAVFRPIAAFATGLIGGTLMRFDRKIETTDGEPAQPSSTCCSNACGDETQRPAWRRALHHGLVEIPNDIAGALVVGVLLAGTISALIPNDFFTVIVGSGLLTMLIMLFLGIPLYVCATASIPIAAALVAKGVSPGAALVFLITGPATNAATLSIVWRMLGRRATAIYLVTVAATAILSGLLLDQLLTVLDVADIAPHHDMLPLPVRIVSIVLLMGVLARPLFKKLRTLGRPT